MCQPYPFTKELSVNANTSAAAIVEDGARVLAAERHNHGSCWDRGCRPVLEMLGSRGRRMVADGGQ